jgi:hypothetical protein
VHKGSASTIHQHPLLIPLPQRRPRPVCARGAAEAGGRPRLERGPFCFSRRAAARCGGPPSSGLLLGPPQNQRGVSGGSQAFFDSKLRAAPGRSCGALATARCHKQVGKTCRGWLSQRTMHWVLRQRRCRTTPVPVLRWICLAQREWEEQVTKTLGDSQKFRYARSACQEWQNCRC